MDQEKRFYKIRLYLKKNDSTVSKDKAIFESCKMGRMSLKECKKQFMKNNDVPRAEKVSDETFRLWLNWIGYEVRA